MLMCNIVLFEFDFVSALLGLSFGVYTVRVTISCIYYFVFTISFYFIHSINLSGYLAASVQIKPVVKNNCIIYRGIERRV